MAGTVYTVRITVEDPAGLDGVTPIGSTAVIRRDQTLGLIDVTIPSGTLFGVFDPGELTEQENQTFVVAALLVNSFAGGPGVHSPGSIVGIRSPPGLGGAPAKNRVLVDLADPPGLGLFPLSGSVIPIGHSLVFDTAADPVPEGPHTIQLLLVAVDSPEAAQTMSSAIASGGLAAVGGITCDNRVAGVATIVGAVSTFVPVGTGNPATHPLYVADTKMTEFSIRPTVGPTAPTQVIQYDGAREQQGILFATLSLSTGAILGVGFEVEILKNGIAIPNSIGASAAGILGLDGQATVAVTSGLRSGDQFQVVVANTTDGTPVVCELTRLEAVAVGRAA